MAKRPERRSLVDPAVADILSSDRRVKPSEPQAKVSQTKAPGPTGQASVKPKTDNRDKPMTYRIGNEIIERINVAADTYNVEKSSLVKFLLSHSLEALEKGKLKLPLKERPHQLDI